MAPTNTVLAPVSLGAIPEGFGGEFDFHFTEAGEFLARPPIVCEEFAPDGRCGCSRSFSGLKSGSGTTFAVVRAVNVDDLLAAAAEACVRGGWGEDLIPAYQENALMLPDALADQGLPEGSLIKVEWRTSDNDTDAEAEEFVIVHVGREATA